jgi:hypothetical protein
LTRLASFDEGRLTDSTYYPCHRKPHTQSPAEFLANKEGQDTSCERTQVVDADDDSLESTAWVSERVAPVFVADDA